MSLDFIRGKSFLVKGTARVRAITAAGTLEDQQGGHSDRVREVRSRGRPGGSCQLGEDCGFGF